MGGVSRGILLVSGCRDTTVDIGIATSGLGPCVLFPGRAAVRPRWKRSFTRCLRAGLSQSRIVARGTGAFVSASQRSKRPGKYAMELSLLCAQWIGDESAIDGRGSSLHRLPYIKTDCSGSFEVVNNGLASASLLIRGAGGHRRAIRNKDRRRAGDGGVRDSAGLSLGEAFGNDRVGRGIECHSDVSARNLDVLFRIHGHTISPVDDAILARVNCSFDHRAGNLSVKRAKKIAGAATGVAIGQNSLAMLLENTKTNSFGGA